VVGDELVDEAGDEKSGAALPAIGASSTTSAATTLRSVEHAAQQPQRRIPRAAARLGVPVLGTSAGSKKSTSIVM